MSPISITRPTDALSTHCQRLHLTTQEYRPDIDGLRALAILAVIVFHAFPEALPGGFVGVDIFFVISGYLISRHIFANLAQHGFSYLDFYSRRIKRIFPALIFVLIAGIAIGWVLLTPDEYKMLAKLIMGGTSFSANFVLWKQAGYFDSAAETKPLLHLWSLAIEEQFYIVWPLVLQWVWRLPKTLILRIIVGLSVISLLFSLWLVRHDTVADFYSPLSRFWELSIGSLMAFSRQQTSVGFIKRHQNLLAGLGLCLILTALFALDRHASFPGAWALLPTVGAVCLMLAGTGNQTAWLNQHVLANPLMIWIGLISYPLYLWHWPLLTFAHIAESSLPDPSIRLSMLAISVILAWVSYRFIELPVRASRGQASRRWVVALSIALLMVFLAGWLISSQHGFKFRTLSRLDGDVTTMVLGADRDTLLNECGLAEPAKTLKWEFCKSSSGQQVARYVVIGDSKAEALFYGLARESKPVDGILIGSVGAPDASKDPLSANQQKNRIALETVVNNPNLERVYLVKALRTLFKTNQETGFIEPEAEEKYTHLLSSYSQAIKKLEDAGKIVVFVVDNPTLPDPHSCISGGMTSSELLNKVFRRKPNPKCQLTYSDHLEGTKAYRQFISRLQQQHPNLVVYDPATLLCDTKNNLCTPQSKTGQYFYSYSDHISDYANSLIARELKGAKKGARLN